MTTTGCVTRAASLATPRAEAQVGAKPPPTGSDVPEAQPSHASHVPPHVDASAVRVAGFVDDVQRTACEQTRFLSAMWVGELVGAAVGAAVALPLGLGAGSVFAMSLSATVFGGLGVAAGYLAETLRAGERAPDAPLLAVGGAARAVSNIAFPTVSAAQASDVAVIQSALDALPLSAVTSVSRIETVQGLEGIGASGIALPQGFRNAIALDPNALVDAEFGRTTTIHEIGHTVDFSQGIGPEGAASLFGPYGKGPFWVDPRLDLPNEAPYAATNRLEDFAQTHLAYHTEPDKLQALLPEKFAHVDAMYGPSVTGQVLDRPAVREVGQQIGEMTGRVPGARGVLDLAAAVVAPLALHGGAARLERGLVDDDADARFAGKMRLAQAFSYLFKAAAPIGLAASIAHGIYRSRVASGRLSAQDAERHADGWLTLTAGPVGAAGLAVARQVRENAATATETPVSTSEPAGVSAVPAQREDAASLSEAAPAQPARGSGAVTAAAAAVGMAGVGQVVGAAVGTALGGVAGAFVGAWWGRVGGGLLGMGAVSALQAHRRAARNPAQRLTAADARGLASVVGGAGIGSALGAAAGIAGGAAVGGLVGGAVAGPLGATLGSLAVQMVAAPILSAAGARRGAALGSQRAA